MSGAPPPSFWELHVAVSDYLNKGKCVSGWAIDAREEAERGRLSVFPYVDAKGAGAHVLYQHSLPKDRVLDVVAKLPSKAASLREFLPTLSLTTKTAGSNATAILSANLHTSEGSISVAHPVVFATSKTTFTDKCSTIATASTRLTNTAFVGAMVDYEPKRSGIREFVAVALQRNCPSFFGGDVMAKYNLRNGLSAHLRLPLHPMVDVAVVGERTGFLAGLQARSPCGACLMGSVNLTDSSYTLTAIRNLKDIWKITLTYTASIPSSGNQLSAPRVGLLFSNMDSEGSSCGCPH